MGFSNCIIRACYRGQYIYIVIICTYGGNWACIYIQKKKENLSFWVWYFWEEQKPDSALGEYLYWFVPLERKSIISSLNQFGSGFCGGGRQRKTYVCIGRV